MEEGRGQSDDFSKSGPIEHMLYIGIYMVIFEVIALVRINRFAPAKRGCSKNADQDYVYMRNSQNFLRLELKKKKKKWGTVQFESRI